MGRPLLACLLVLILLTSAWPFLPGAGAADYYVEQEGWESTLPEGWTMEGVVAAVDCFVAYQGSCSLQVDPRGPGSTSSASLALDHALGSAPYNVAFFFRHAEVVTDTDSLFEMSFDQGERVKFWLRRAGSDSPAFGTSQLDREVMLSYEQGSAQSADSGQRSGQSNYGLTGGQWYLATVTFNFTAAQAEVAIVRLDGQALTEEATFPIAPNITRVTGIRFEGTYHGSDPLAKPPRATHYDQLLLTTLSPPEAPAEVLATAGPGRGQNTLGWTPPPQDPRAPIMHYRVYAGENATTLAPVANTSLPTFTESGLGDGTTRTYAVSAVNVAGEGPRSLLANATTYMLPGIPTLAAEAAPSTGSAQIEWQPPAIDGGAPIIAYRIYHALGNGTLQPLALHAGGHRGHIAQRLAPGQVHAFAISAENVVGEGPLSPAVQVALPPSPFPSDECDLYRTLTNDTTRVFTLDAEPYCFVTEGERPTLVPRYLNPNGTISLRELETFLDALVAYAEAANVSVNRSEIEDALIYKPQGDDEEPVDTGVVEDVIGPIEWRPIGCIVDLDGRICQSSQPPSPGCFPCPRTGDATQEAYAEPKDPNLPSILSPGDIQKNVTRMLDETRNGTSIALQEVQRNLNRSVRTVNDTVSAIARCAGQVADGLPEVEPLALPGVNVTELQDTVVDGVACVTTVLNSTASEIVAQSLDAIEGAGPTAQKTADAVLNAVMNLTASALAPLETTLSDLVRTANQVVQQTTTTVFDTIEETVPLGEAKALLDQLPVAGPAVGGLLEEREGLVGLEGQLQPLGAQGVNWSASSRVGSVVPAIQVPEAGLLASVYTRTGSGVSELELVHPVLLNNRTCLSFDAARATCGAYVTVSSVTDGDLEKVTATLERAAHLTDMEVAVFYHLPATIEAETGAIAVAYLQSRNAAPSLPERATYTLGGLSTVHDPQDRKVNLTLQFEDAAPRETWTAALQAGVFEYERTDFTRARPTGNHLVVDVAEGTWGRYVSFDAKAQRVATFDSQSVRVTTDRAVTLDLRVADTLDDITAGVHWNGSAPEGVTYAYGNHTSVDSRLTWAAPSNLARLELNATSHVGTFLQVNASQARSGNLYVDASQSHHAAWSTAQASGTFQAALARAAAECPAGGAFLVDVDDAARCASVSLRGTANVTMTASASGGYEIHSLNSVAAQDLLVHDARYDVRVELPTAPSRWAAWMNKTLTAGAPKLDLAWSSTSSPGLLLANFTRGTTSLGLDAAGVPTKATLSLDPTTQQGALTANGRLASADGFLTSSGQRAGWSQPRNHVALRQSGTTADLSFGLDMVRAFTVAIGDSATLSADISQDQPLTLSIQNPEYRVELDWANAKGAPFSATARLDATSFRYDHDSSAAVARTSVDVERGASRLAMVAGSMSAHFEATAGWAAVQTPFLTIVADGPATSLTLAAGETASRTRPSATSYLVLDNLGAPGVLAALESTSGFHAKAMDRSIGIDTSATAVPLAVQVAARRGAVQDFYNLSIQGQADLTLDLDPAALHLSASAAVGLLRLDGDFGATEHVEFLLEPAPRTFDANWTSPATSFAYHLAHDHPTPLSRLRFNRTEATAPDLAVVFDLQAFGLPQEHKLDASQAAGVHARGLSQGVPASVGDFRASFRAAAAPGPLLQPPAEGDSVVLAHGDATSPFEGALRLHDYKDVDVLLLPAEEAASGLAEIRSHAVATFGASARDLAAQTTWPASGALRAFRATGASGAMDATFTYANRTGAFTIDTPSGNGKYAWSAEDAARYVNATYDATDGVNIQWPANETFALAASSKISVRIDAAPLGLAVAPPESAGDYVVARVDPLVAQLGVRLTSVTRAEIVPGAGTISLIGDPFTGPTQVLVNGTQSVTLRAENRPASLTLAYGGDNAAASVNLALSASLSAFELGLEGPNGPYVYLNGTTIGAGDNLLMQSDITSGELEILVPQGAMKLSGQHRVPLVAREELSNNGVDVFLSRRNLFTLSDIVEVAVTRDAALLPEFEVQRLPTALAQDVHLTYGSPSASADAWIEDMMGGTAIVRWEVDAATVATVVTQPVADAVRAVLVRAPPDLPPTTPPEFIAANFSGGPGQYSAWLDTLAPSLWLESTAAAPATAFDLDAAWGSVALQFSATGVPAFDLRTSDDFLHATLASDDGSAIGTLRAAVATGQYGAARQVPQHPTDAARYAKGWRTQEGATLLLDLKDVKDLHWTAPATPDAAPVHFSTNHSADSTEAFEWDVSSPSEQVLVRMPAGTPSAASLTLATAANEWWVEPETGEKPLDLRYQDNLNRSVSFATSRDIRRANISLPDADQAARYAISVLNGVSLADVEVGSFWASTFMEANVDDLAPATKAFATFDAVSGQGRVELTETYLAQAGEVFLRIVPNAGESFNTLRADTDFIAVDSSGDSPYLSSRLSNLVSANWTIPLGSATPEFHLRVDRTAEVASTRLFLYSPSGDSLSLDAKDAASFSIATRHAGPSVAEATRVSLTATGDVGRLVGSAFSAASRQVAWLELRDVPALNTIELMASPILGLVGIDLLGSGTTGFASFELSEDDIFSQFEATDMDDGLSVQLNDDCGPVTATRRILDVTLDAPTAEYGGFSLTWGRAPPNPQAAGNRMTVLCEDSLNIDLSLQNLTDAVVDLLPCGFHLIAPGSSLAPTKFYGATTEGLLEGHWQPDALVATLDVEASCQETLEGNKAHFDYEVREVPSGTPAGIASLLVRYTDLGLLECMKLNGACVKLLQVDASDFGDNLVFDATTGADLLDVKLNGPGGDKLGLYIWSDAKDTKYELPDNVDVNVTIPVNHTEIILTNVSNPYGGTAGENVIDLVALDQEKTIIVNFLDFAGAVMTYHNDNPPGLSDDNVRLTMQFQIQADAPSRPLHAYLRTGKSGSTAAQGCDVNHFAIKDLPHVVRFDYTRVGWVTNSATFTASTGIQAVEWANRLGAGCNDGETLGEIFARIEEIPASFTIGYSLGLTGHVQVGNAGDDQIKAIRVGYRSAEFNNRYISLYSRDIGVGVSWNLIPGDQPFYVRCGGQIGANIGASLRWDDYGIGADYGVGHSLVCPDFQVLIDGGWTGIVKSFLEGTFLAKRYACLYPAQYQNAADLASHFTVEFIWGGRSYTVPLDWISDVGCPDDSGENEGPGSPGSG